MNIEKIIKGLAAAGVPWGWVLAFAFLALILTLGPRFIRAVSTAVKEHRQLSHKREQALLKIRNSVTDRRRTKQPAKVERR